MPVNRLPDEIVVPELAVQVLREALGEAFEFIECYCNCGEARNGVAKRARQALLSTDGFVPPVDVRRRAERS